MTSWNRTNVLLEEVEGPGGVSVCLLSVSVSCNKQP